MPGDGPDIRRNHLYLLHVPSSVLWYGRELYLYFGRFLADSLFVLLIRRQLLYRSELRALRRVDSTLDMPWRRCFSVFYSLLQAL